MSVALHNVNFKSVGEKQESFIPILKLIDTLIFTVGMPNIT